MSKAKPITHKKKMRAYKRGYDAANKGAPFVSPYTAPALMDQWIHGYQVGRRSADA